MIMNKLSALPALGASVQPNRKNHDDHQDRHPGAYRGEAGGPEGHPNSPEQMPMPSPSSSQRKSRREQRGGQHVQSPLAARANMVKDFAPPWRAIRPLQPGGFALNGALLRRTSTLSIWNPLRFAEGRLAGHARPSGTLAVRRNKTAAHRG
jgi:hypothetical protein